MDKNLEDLIEEINDKYEEQIEGGIFLETILFGLLLRERSKCESLELRINELKREKYERYKGEI